jgi:hypothetical protein
MACSGKTTFLVVAVLAVMYVLHRALQYDHYRRCQSDMLSVLLFGPSAACVQGGLTLRLLERAYRQVIAVGLPAVVAYLPAAVAGAGPGAVAGAGPGAVAGPEAARIAPPKPRDIVGATITA